MSYYTLKSDSGFLRGYKFGPGESVTQDEVDKAEAQAQRDIYEVLQKHYPAGSIPETLKNVADKLSSAEVIGLCLRNTLTGAGREYAKDLKAEAVGTLAEIKEKKRGLELTDGSWDRDFQGDDNPEEGKTGDSWRFLS